MLSGTTIKSRLVNVRLLILETTRHPSLSIEVLRSDRKRCLTPASSLFWLGTWPAERRDFTLAKFLSLSWRKAIAFLFSKGSLAFPEMRSCASPAAWPASTAPIIEDGEAHMLQTDEDTEDEHSLINEWSLQLTGSVHRAGLQLAKLSGQFLDMLPEM